MLDWFISILREYPPLVLFLTIGLGFLIGRIKFGNFQLGSVTSVLLVGVIIGQLDVPIDGPIKSFFFMLFLFSIGYSVGPDFFKSLRGSGLKQVLFAVIMSASCFGITLLMSWLLSYGKGETVGLFSGSETCSALLGVGSEAIQKLGLPPEKLSEQMNIIPVCYAVTYIFGTLGTVILLGNFGPKLLGGLDKVKIRTRELEEKLSKKSESDDPALVRAQREAAYRAYSIENEYFDTPRTRGEIEKYLHNEGLQIYVDRIEKHGEIIIPRYDDFIERGDKVVVCGRIEFMVNAEQYLGPEVLDRELMDYHLARVGVVVANKDFTGIPLTELRERPFMHGVVVRDVISDGESKDIDLNTEFAKGDRITLLGRDEKVKNAAKHIGHVDRPSISSDLVFVGLAIFIGGFFGAITIWVDSIPVSFGTSGGALIAGLVFGWLRSKHPTFGNIPRSAIWVMNNLGLNVFIAVIGLNAAPSFVAGLRAVGPMLFVAGVVCTLVPLLIGLWLGQKVFKFNPAITLGCCAGTRTCTASLGAVQTALGSSLPAIGYTVTYAVSNILLVIWGLLTVILIP